MVHSLTIPQISRKSAHNVFSYPANKQTSGGENRAPTKDDEYTAISVQQRHNAGYYERRELSELCHRHK